MAWEQEATARHAITPCDRKNAFPLPGARFMSGRSCRPAARCA
ncbi:hypothetical protein SSKA14_996 [Stenotrophomonas sp. SKA14]|nr:hypothetical protein SSKA14_996 [Stenotrophomonas sp. SKA14]